MTTTFAPEARMEAWLRDWLVAQGGIAGTVHLRVDEELRIAAAINIPQPVVNATHRVARGKGMAGLAWERASPVSTRNLQTPSPDVRPAARLVSAFAAVALPVRDRDGGVRAIVGIAYPDERDLDDVELERLVEAAQELPDA